MKHAKPREASQRQLRVGELIRHALADLLQRGEIHDPVFARAVLIVSEVRVTPDLKTATAYFMPLGGQDLEAVSAAFERHRKFIRHEVLRRVSLRRTPQLRFRVDPSFDEASHIDALLRLPRVSQDLAGDDSDHDNDDDTESG